MKDAFSSQSILSIHRIKEFYDWHGLGFALQDMEQMIKYAIKEKYYRAGSPYTLVYFTQGLQQLIADCFIMQDEFGLQQIFEVPAGEKGMPDLSRTEDFMPASHFPVWEYLPRHISKEQYLNPIKAFRRFCRFKTEAGWKTIVNDLLEYALSTTAVNEGLPDYNILKIRKLLLQMIEAGYLIYIRYRRQCGEIKEVAPEAEATSDVAC